MALTGKHLKRIARTWKYALGSFNDRKTHKYDNAVAIIRTIILLSYLTTNVFITAGVIRHWNDNNGQHYEAPPGRASNQKRR